ncbi:MAG: Hpt domain-containing protein [Proteobacteria bacterium]|nr:Hpt domain-containing protein [Pseudomonadota bacterium]MBI3499906.1 Hpt domain-containing protein [Pseudomonadota bacterium]
MADFLKPPRELGDKTGPGVPLGGRAIIAKAEGATKRHLQRVNYRTIAKESLDRLRVLLPQLTDHPDSADIAKKIYEVAHNLRGEGASFGYPAISNVAELICRLIERPSERTGRQLRILNVQIDALRAMVRHNIKGAPQGIALEIITALATLVDRVAALNRNR